MDRSNFILKEATTRYVGETVASDSRHARGAWRPRFTYEKHFRPNEKCPCRWGPTRSIPRELHRGMRGRIRRTSVFRELALASNYPVLRDQGDLFTRVLFTFYLLASINIVSNLYEIYVKIIKLFTSFIYNIQYYKIIHTI